MCSVFLTCFCLLLVVLCLSLCFSRPVGAISAPAHYCFEILTELFSGLRPSIRVSERSLFHRLRKLESTRCPAPADLNWNKSELSEPQGRHATYQRGSYRQLESKRISEHKRRWGIPPPSSRPVLFFCVCAHRGIIH